MTSLFDNLRDDISTILSHVSPGNRCRVLEHQIGTNVDAFLSRVFPVAFPIAVHHSVAGNVNAKKKKKHSVNLIPY